MEKKSTGKTVIIVILLLAVIGLGGYIVYDKFIVKDETKELQSEINALKLEIKTLKVGKYIVLGGEASKITSLTTSSPGKHGAAKARLEAVGIFDNQKRSIVKPVDTKVDIPIIDKRVGQVLSIQGNNVQLMDMESYETLDLEMPEDLKDQIAEGIEVEYLVALGNMKIMRTK